METSSASDSTPWHEVFYQIACECVCQSWEHWEAGNISASWRATIPARLAYLCDVVVDVVVIPFYLVQFLFSASKGIFTWNWESTRPVRHDLLKKTNHLFLSFFGTLCSPAIAYRYRDANLAPYIIAARIVVILAGITYFAFRR